MEKSSATIHERLTHEEGPTGGSDRALGVVFAVVLTIGAVWPLLRGNQIRGWCLAVGAIFLALALLRPRTLAPVNKLWLMLGLALHACISPVVMALLYYTTVTPVGLLLRLLGKDVLRLRIDRASPTYWIERQPPGPAPDTMRRQF
jgi:hypothetical protein